jgi:hypothetical protein
MSVDSIFFSTGIGGGASGEVEPVWPRLDERRMKGQKPLLLTRFLDANRGPLRSKTLLAPDSPNWQGHGARQSKTAASAGLNRVAARPEAGGRHSSTGMGRA